MFMEMLDDVMLLFCFFFENLLKMYNVGMLEGKIVFKKVVMLFIESILGDD